MTSKGEYIIQKLALNILKGPLFLVDINDIIFFEKENKLIKVVIKNYKKPVYLNMSMKSLQNILENKTLFNIYFMRPHCSYIVNINHIKVLSSKQLLMSNKEYIPISSSKHKSFFKLISNNMDIIQIKSIRGE